MKKYLSVFCIITMMDIAFPGILYSQGKADQGMNPDPHQSPLGIQPPAEILPQVDFLHKDMKGVPSEALLQRSIICEDHLAKFFGGFKSVNPIIFASSYLSLIHNRIAP